MVISNVLYDEIESFMVNKGGQNNEIYEVFLIKTMKRRMCLEKDWKFIVCWFNFKMNSFFNQLIGTKQTK